MRLNEYICGDYDIGVSNLILLGYRNWAARPFFGKVLLLSWVFLRTY